MAAPDVRPRVQPTTDVVSFERPYPPGWFDRLIDWVERAPGPNEAYLIGLLVVLALYVSGVIWWNGTLPLGEIAPLRLFIVVVSPYLLWARFHLDRVACRALDEFRPALDVDEREL